MANRDLALRDAFHKQLEEYIQPLDEDEYQRFLGTEAEQIEQLMAKKPKVSIYSRLSTAAVEQAAYGILEKLKVFLPIYRMMIITTHLWTS